MTRLLEAVLNGVSLGSLYSLIALGFVIIFRATGVMNFAHSSFLLAGAYVTAAVSAKSGFLVGLLAGVVTAAAIGAFTQLVILRFSKDKSHLGLSVLSLGVNILAVTEITRRIGDNTLPLHDPWQASVWRFAGITVPVSRVAALAVAAALLAGFLLLFRFTRWGLALRVSAADREVAALVGVPMGRVSWTSWAIGGAMAALAGMFLAAFPAPGVEPSLTNSAMRAFPAAVLGGLDSIPGALVGGLAIGIAESLTATYEGHLGGFGSGASGLVAYVVLFAVLLLRPDGLFGTKVVSRV
ncbi:branched-chain amino acid ABC transporter permease [Micromonospora sp. NPDC007271]|uniref:branched-chain amino acid ABC transporter permease n=1 Tax=Micromonospora sp. NPDC007271 TaxID=3154587 RepID=UPI0033C3D2E1